MKLQTEQDAYWPEYLSQETREKVSQFREQLQSNKILIEGQDDDITLARFLKARKYDLKQAETMYANFAKWRRENNIDDIENVQFTEHEQKTIQRMYPQFYHLVDKFGRPVYVEVLGKLNPKDLLEVVNMDRFVKYHIQQWELLKKYKLPVCARKVGRSVAGCCTILDLNGVSLWQFNGPVRQFLSTVLQIDQDYYPEHLGIMFIINAPVIFTMIWAFVKNFIDEATQKKVVVLGSNYKSQLLNYISEENLLEQFGGKSKLGPGIRSDEGPWNEDVSDDGVKRLGLLTAVHDDLKADSTTTSNIPSVPGQ